MKSSRANKLLEKAQSVARSLADGPTFAHSMTKKCLHQEWNLSIEQAHRDRGRGAGDLHADQGLRTRVQRIRRQAETAVPGRLRSLLFALLLAAQTASSQDAPPVLRLPDGVRPLQLRGRTHAAARTQSGFRGAIDIEIEVQRETPVVWLNARFLQVDGARIDGRAAQVLPGGEDFVGLRPEAPLAPGRAAVRIEYRGELSERDNVGAFRMREGGDWYVYTQLESIFARRVFPCFDEPGFKVPWQLSLVVPVGDIAVSNTPTLSETVLRWPNRHEARPLRAARGRCRAT